jgi:hypothetical protein
MAPLEDGERTLSLWRWASSTRSWAISERSSRKQDGQFVSKQLAVVDGCGDDCRRTCSIGGRLWLLLSRSSVACVAEADVLNIIIVRRRCREGLLVAVPTKASYPLVTGHGLLGVSLTVAGHIAEGRAHFDQSMALP